MKQHILENHIYNMDCLAGCELLEAGSVDFIIADPPFYRVKGEFDFSFQSFEEYKEKLKEWAEAFKRVLKPNRYLVIYGDYRRIAYVQVIFDNYFTLRNNCTVAKNNSLQKKCKTYLFRIVFL
jgi:site-specific DNA-methyltransferase (adenine-specific)